MNLPRKRLPLILTGALVLAVIAALVLHAFSSNLVFFFSPTQVAAGEAPNGKIFRICGVVKEASFRRGADGVTLSFVITDTEKDLVVRFRGVLPDLFREGKGAVVQVRIGDDGVFAASEVLARHDENYTPPEAAQALGEANARAQIRKARETLRGR